MRQARKGLFQGFSLGPGARRAPSGFAMGSAAKVAEGGNELGEGRRIDCTYREGLGSDEKAGNEGRGREDFGAGRHFFLGVLGCSDFGSHSHPGRNDRNVFRVNSIWPMPFHCLPHTAVSTTSQNTHDPHIPPEFRKCVGPRRLVRDRKGSAWVTSGGSVWILKSTPLTSMKSRPETSLEVGRPRGFPRP
jgi:hypothetical protein